MKTYTILIIILILFSCNRKQQVHTKKETNNLSTDTIIKSFPSGEILVMRNDGNLTIKILNNNGELTRLDTFLTNDEWVHLEDYNFILFRNYNLFYAQYVYSGTAHESYVKVYLIDTVNLSLTPIPFKYASGEYRSKLINGQCICKGEWVQFSNNRIVSTFYIWNKEDGNCCPTAGEVNVKYGIVMNNNKLCIQEEHHQLKTDSLISIYDIY